MTNLVKKWEEKVEKARKFDKQARNSMAFTRRYARGDSSFPVSVNMLGSFIDVLQAFVYAQDPEIEARPSPSVGNQRTAEAAELGKSMEIVAQQLWRAAKLKDRAKMTLRTALTVGLGWMKASWQDSTARDPVVSSQLSQLEDNRARIQAMLAEIDAGDVADLEAKKQEIELSIASLNERVEKLVARGLAIDHVPSEDITIPQGIGQINQYLDAPWIDHRLFMRPEDVSARFGIPVEKLGQATSYSQRRPEMQTGLQTPALRDSDENDADAFIKGGGMGGDSDTFIAVHETWDKNTGHVLLWAEGMAEFLKQPQPPAYATTRFYPFFMLGFLWVDGERWPQSHVYRSWKLMDEYNRTRSRSSTHRRRAIPKSLLNASLLSPKEVKKIESAETGEIVAVKMNTANGEVGNLIREYNYPRFDRDLYDTADIRADMEAIWGVQEALAGGVRTAKTATEAEIQQTGTQARTAIMRDAVEDMLSDLANYTAQLAVGALSPEEAREIAGPDALWVPQENITPEDLDALLVLDIRAGSTGKPNTAANQQAWSVIMPVLQNAITGIGQLRQSSPQQIANALEQLVIQTMEVTGQRLDPSRFIPAEGQPQPSLDPSAAQLPPEIGALLQGQAVDNQLPQETV